MNPLSEYQRLAIYLRIAGPIPGLQSWVSEANQQTVESGRGKLCLARRAADFQPPSALREVLNETIFSGKSGRGFKPDGELYRVAWALHSGGSPATDKSGNGHGAGINIYDSGSGRSLIGARGTRSCDNLMRCA